MQLAVSLLFLFVPCCLPGVSSLKVIQSEDVTVKEGDTANISCCWSSERERAVVQWWKNKTKIQHELQTDCSFLIIASITQEHSGTYICKVTVDIPLLKQGQGKGTVITVLSTEKTEETNDSGDSNDHEDAVASHSLDVLGQVLRCLPVLTLVLVSIYLYKTLVMKRRRRQEREPRPQRGQNDIELQRLES